MRAGFVSSDFGVHPVVTLLRGLIAVLERRGDVEVYCYALSAEDSWWRQNISATATEMRQLTGLSHAAAAAILRNDQLDAAFDLNGHTLATGLPILAYRPAPIQVSFLGYLAPTAAPFIDYVIADRHVVAAERTSSEYTEAVAMMTDTFLVNDYRQLHAHVPKSARMAARNAIPNSTAGPRRFLFATFCNYQKIDPTTFLSWMNVLKRTPWSNLWILRHHAFPVRGLPPIKP